MTDHNHSSQGPNLQNIVRQLTTMLWHTAG